MLGDRREAGRAAITNSDEEGAARLVVGGEDGREAESEHLEMAFEANVAAPEKEEGGRAGGQQEKPIRRHPPQDVPVRSKGAAAAARTGQGQKRGDRLRPGGS